MNAPRVRAQASDVSLSQSRGLVEVIDVAHVSDMPTQRNSEFGTSRPVVSACDPLKLRTQLTVDAGCEDLLSGVVSRFTHRNVSVPTISVTYVRDAHDGERKPEARTAGRSEDRSCCDPTPGCGVVEAVLTASVVW
jgi:hypothetical protein